MPAHIDMFGAKDTSVGIAWPNTLLGEDRLTEDQFAFTLSYDELVVIVGTMEELQHLVHRLQRVLDSPVDHRVDGDDDGEGDDDDDDGDV